jgi:hypothetical protein
MTLVITRDKINKRLKKRIKERIKYILSLMNDRRKYEIILLTLTFRDNEQYKEFKEKYMKGFLNNLCRNYGVEFYFRAEELQQRGVMHIHLFLIKKRGFRIGFIDKEKKYKEVMGLTNIKIIRDRDINNVTNYMLKYLTKSLKIDIREYKRVTRIGKRIRRYSLWIPKRYRDNKKYRLIMCNSRIERLCLQKDIRIKKEEGYKVIMNEGKILKYRFEVEKYIEDNNFELYIDRIEFILKENDIVLHEEYEIENEQDLKEIYNLIINLMDLN